MRRRTVILLSIVLFGSLSVVPLSAIASSVVLNRPTELWLEPNSSRDFAVACNGGDTLMGRVRVLQDGDLFPQDQTKYDFWLYVGINLILLDAREYGNWFQGFPVDPLLERVHTSEVSWSLQVSSGGLYHIVYWTDSAYGKLILVSHSVASMVLTVLLAIGLTGLVITATGFVTRGRHLTQTR